MTPEAPPAQGAECRNCAGVSPTEWNAQRDVIDPAAMPLTRLANAIIDGVADAPEAVRDEIEKYLGSDLVFYRAEAPEGLVAQQARAWDPLLDFARDELGARFVLAQGVVHRDAAARRHRRRSESHPDRESWLLGGWRARRHHDTDRLGADRAGACRGHIGADRGLGRRACRRGLEHGPMGPR